MSSALRVEGILHGGGWQRCDMCKRNGLQVPNSLLAVLMSLTACACVLVRWRLVANVDAFSFDAPPPILIHFRSKQFWSRTVPLLNELEVCEGAFIRLYDPAITLDSPQLFGQIHHFIGYTTTHVVALLNIFTFYRFGDLLSYSTGEIIHPSLRLREQTIILIARPRCRFEQEPTLALRSEDVDINTTCTFLHSEGMVAWGPKRDWPNRADWKGS